MKTEYLEALTPKERATAKLARKRLIVEKYEKIGRLRYVEGLYRKLLSDLAACWDADTDVYDIEKLKNLVDIAVGIY